MIELLKTPEGATVEQIAAATGWQHHTIRGAISGALKKKLGLTVEATRTREVGPNKTGAKSSSTVYGSPGKRGSSHMHRLLKQPGYRLLRAGQPGGQSPARRAGPRPRRPRPRPRPPRRHRGHRGPDHRWVQRGRRVRHQPRRMAAGPARHAPGAIHPAPVGQGPRAARPRAEGSAMRFEKDGTLPGESQRGTYRLAS
jgi:hypothetical protein